MEDNLFFFIIILNTTTTYTLPNQDKVIPKRIIVAHELSNIF